MNIRPKTYLLLTALALVIVWLVCWFVETSFVLLSTYPQGYVIGLLAGVAIAYPTLRRALTRPVSRVLLASFAIALMSINIVPPWQSEPVQSFMLFYRDIHPGGDLVAVRQALDQRFPIGGALSQPVCQERQAAPTQKAFSCILDPNQGAYNAEIITVYLKDDRVTHKEYSAD
jgi:branched-subunit amino acid ABC-type transport system permease component